MKRCYLALVITLLAAALAGCTFQSNQLDSLRELVTPAPDVPPEARWVLTWQDREWPLISVVTETQTFFVWEDSYALFVKGWNLSQGMGLIAGATIRIEPQGDELLYFVNDRLFERHKCQPWQDITPQADTHTFQLNCTSPRGDYTNEMQLDSQGMVVRVKYFLHPQYPPLILAPVQ